MIVDSHQHVWRLDRGDYGWLSRDLAPLYRDFLPEHVLEAHSRCGVQAAVLVQAAPTEAETEFLLDLARTHAFIAGVVGWTDFEAADAPSRIRALAARGNGRLKGFRPMIQDLEDPSG